MDALFAPRGRAVFAQVKPGVEGSAQPPEVLSVSVTPASAVISGGVAQDFNETVTGTGAFDASVKWNTTLGQVNAAGTVIAPPATTTPQTGVVTATSNANPQKYGSAIFTVAALSAPPQAPGVSAPGASLVATSTLSPGAGVIRTSVFASGAKLHAAAAIEAGAGTGGLPTPQFGYAGARSKARTLVVYPADTELESSADAEIGTFWDLSNPDKPKGVKDPQDVIDVSIDWTPVLLDAVDQYNSHVVVKLTGGLALIATGHNAGVTTMFVAGGAVGRTATITVQLRSASSPARVYERTLYLKIKSL